MNISIKRWAVKRWTVLALLLCACRAAPAAPPTDPQIDEAITAFATATKAIKPDLEEAMFEKTWREAGVRALEGVSLAEASTDQLAKLNRAELIAAAGKTTEARARLTELASDPGLPGFRAAVLRMAFLPSTWVPDLIEDGTDPARADPNKLAADRKQHAEAIKQADTARLEHRQVLSDALKHPALPEAVQAKQVGPVFAYLGRLDDEVADESITGLVQLEPALAGLPPQDVRRLSTFVDILARAPQSKLDPATRDRIRAKVADVATAALAATPDTPQNKHPRNVLTGLIEFTNGAYARGQLIGHPSPALTFTWIGPGTTFKTLADLRGKVVVLDFLTTWCGPCIASFPKIRELVAHYEGYPVVVLSITSVQGFHKDFPSGVTAGPKHIDCENDPAKEMALMPDFMRQLNMTWPVAFSAQNVFNPDFGVQGVPHVAIIDPAGVVRYNGLHPGTHQAEKIQKINALLKEVNLPAPADTVSVKPGG